MLSEIQLSDPYVTQLNKLFISEVEHNIGKLEFTKSYSQQTQK